MSNPYMPRYTSAERAAIRTGRSALLSRWNAEPFTEGKRDVHEFRVEFVRAEIGRAGVVGRVVRDVFRGYNAPAADALPPAWRAFMCAHGMTLRIESPHEFLVLVPHAYYLPTGTGALVRKCLGVCACSNAVLVLGAFVVCYAAFALQRWAREFVATDT